jgi:hypothetical protein
MNRDSLFTTLDNKPSKSFNAGSDEEGEDSYETGLGAKYDQYSVKNQVAPLIARFVDENLVELEPRPSDIHKHCIEEESSCSDEHRDKLLKRLEELRHNNKLLGPPARSTRRTSKKDAKKVERPQSAKPLAKSKPGARPASALRRTPSALLSNPSKRGPRTDRVALYQQRQRQWRSQPFLASNLSCNRQGRKLNLAPHNHAKDFEVAKLKSVHDFIRQDYVAPHLKRRDAVRMQTRAKMMKENIGDL